MLNKWIPYLFNDTVQSHSLVTDRRNFMLQRAFAALLSTSLLYFIHHFFYIPQITEASFSAIFFCYFAEGKKPFDKTANVAFCGGMIIIACFIGGLLSSYFTYELLFLFVVSFLAYAVTRYGRQYIFLAFFGLCTLSFSIYKPLTFSTTVNILISQLIGGACALLISFLLLPMRGQETTQKAQKRWRDTLIESLSQLPNPHLVGRLQRATRILLRCHHLKEDQRIEIERAALYCQRLLHVYTLLETQSMKDMVQKIIQTWLKNQKLSLAAIALKIVEQYHEKGKFKSFHIEERANSVRLVSILTEMSHAIDQIS